MSDSTSDSRWVRVEDIFHRAIALVPQARAEFLDEACGGDISLRQEVESLLAHESENGSTFAHPAGEGAPQTIAHYRITSKLGQGGMGAVYRATDTKLGREVAIKVLPPSFADDPDRLTRFTREAKVLASLNHPNIAQIYGVEESNGARALVMELVPGETLAAHLNRGRLPIETALNYAKQIAEAFEAAHEKGIIHRDLKPANVMITPDGLVKVLDFGLAAVALDSSSTAGDPMNSPTLTMRATQAGTIMGTAAYMSPEQASGKVVDRRADIWSFGVVLFEMLTGKRLFGGETISHTLADVLRAPIDFDQLLRETPPAIRTLLRRCLERNVRNRLQAIGDGRIVIEEALTGSTPDAVSVTDSRKRTLFPWLVATVGFAAALVVSFIHFREAPSVPPAPVRFQIPAPENITPGALLHLAPDGRKLAFVTGGRLWVHSLESGESHELTDASGTPFWSPNSRFIGYPSQGKLKKIEAAGGPSQTLTDYRSFWGGGAWNQEDMIVFSDRLIGLFRMPASGGVPVQITAFDPARRETTHYAPAFLLDGRHFVYTRRSRNEGKSAIYLGSLDAKPEQQSSTPLVSSRWNPEYAPSGIPGIGYLLFVREDTLMAQPFDNRRLELRGQAVPLAGQVSDGRAFSVSANDVLVFQRRAALDRQLTWYDRAGKILGTVGEPGDYQSVALSPDGTRLAVSKRSGQTANIWLVDLARGDATTRFTFGSASDTNPVWSPDGSRIIFSSNRQGPYDLYQKPANGDKDETVLLKSSDDKYPTSWSPDGRFLLYTVNHPNDKSDIWVLPLVGDGKPISFPVTEFSESQAHLSPDGHWVAYSSNESGRLAVYMRSFSLSSRTVVQTGGKWQVSKGYAQEPRWRGDGRELYYLSLPDYDSLADGKATAVEIATSPGFRAGQPYPLGNSPLANAWDSSNDSKRFLLSVSKSGPQPYTVVLNWQAGLKK